MSRPVILDAFCKAGGAGMGYHRAGFEVVGTDIEAQPRYPFTFARGDFFTVLPELVERYRPVAIHTSPVCKVHTDLKYFSRAGHVDQIPDTRAALEATGLPYVIENVEGAPLLEPVWLCGSMFGLGVQRHRGFELGHWKMDQPACRHAEQRAVSPMYPVKRYHSGAPRIVMSPVIGVYGRGQGLGPGEVELWKQAMGIDWMVRDELSQAIPPAYTRFIGEQLLAHLAADPRPGPGPKPAGPTHPTPTHPPSVPPPPPSPVPAKSFTDVPVLRRVLADGGVESTGTGGPDPYGVSGSGPPLKTPAVALRGRGGGT